MKAAVRARLGLLEVRDVEKPAPSDDEVLIEVHAASINDWDWALLTDTSLMNRVFKPTRNILGSDVAGRIEAVGKNVMRFRPGDEVYGDLSGRWGGFAEYVCARETELAPKPPGMTFVQAAAIPQAAMLAHQGLGELRPGMKILINGAGGGVGTFAVQLAKVHGAEVTGVDSTAKLDMMRAIGFDRVADYTQEDVTKRGESYDLILDVKTLRSVRDFMRVLKPSGIYRTVGGSMPRLLQTFFVRRVRLVMLKKNKDLAYMNELFEAGKLKPVIDGPYPLSNIAQAMQRFGEARHKGKIVIEILLPARGEKVPRSGG